MTGQRTTRFEDGWLGGIKGIGVAMALLLPGLMCGKAFGQHDVHATLIPVATRKAAASFSLMDGAGEDCTAF